MDHTPPTFSAPPHRVISLVPSMTESLFTLGLGSAVVGVTDYCVHPAKDLAGVPRVGGVKNPRIEDILALQPDLVLANQEENTPSTVHTLLAQGVTVWVSFPQTVTEAMEVLWDLVNLFHAPLAVARLQTLDRAVDWARAAQGEQPPVRYFCPIWYEPAGDGPAWWMTFNRYTYCNDLLALLGGENVFAGRQRRYPLVADLTYPVEIGPQAPVEDPSERDTRYPRLTLEEIRAAQPEVILLPDEPFAFSEVHHQGLVQQLADTPAVQQGRVHRIEGSLLTWHGVRLGKAIQELGWVFGV